MFKNKTLDIKIIFKTYSKILKTGYKYFRFPNNFFSTKQILSLFFKTVLKNNFQINPNMLEKL